LQDSVNNIKVNINSNQQLQKFNMLNPNNSIFTEAPMIKYNNQNNNQNISQLNIPNNNQNYQNNNQNNLLNPLEALNNLNNEMKSLQSMIPKSYGINNKTPILNVESNLQTTTNPFDDKIQNKINPTNTVNYLNNSLQQQNKQLISSVVGMLQRLSRFKEH